MMVKYSQGLTWSEVMMVVRRRGSVVIVTER